MKKILLCFLLLVTPLGYAQFQGTWRGTIDIPMNPLEFVVHIIQKDTVLDVTADSPDQGAYGFKIEKGTFVSNEIHLNDSKTGMSYTGILKNDSLIEGKFHQNGMEFPLNLTKGNAVKKTAKPQEPIPPFAYISEEVTFKNHKDGITLAGTLTLPKGKGRYPAIILISGSGPNDRNEEIMGHKPFWVLSDFLTQNGFAVLRYDKRGVKESEGNFNQALIKDFAEDASAAYAYLKTRKEIDPKKIGLLGHSEGGLVAQINASQHNEIPFIILMASPGIHGDELMILQKYTIEKAMGVPEFSLQVNSKLFAEIYQILKKPTTTEVAQKELKAYFETSSYTKNAPESALEGFYELIENKWFREFLAFQPEEYLAKIKSKTFVLNGKKDLQVPWKENTSAIMENLPQKTKSTLITYENLNHMFQTSDTGLPTEYGKIEETIAPQVMEDIVNWLQKNIK